MYLNVHFRDGKKVVAVCDRDLIGKVFSEGERQLDLGTYASFYVGKEATRKEVLEALKEFDSVNIVGPKSTQFAIKKGFFCEKDLMYIKNLPYIHIYKI